MACLPRHVSLFSPASHSFLSKPTPSPLLHFSAANRPHVAISIRNSILRVSFNGLHNIQLGIQGPLRGSANVMRAMKLPGGRGRTVMALIGPECSQTLFCVITVCAAFGQLMETRTKWGAQLSAPLLAMGAGMVLSQARIIPNISPSYDFVFNLAMPMAVALCLLETDVQSIFSDAGSTLKAFWYGALGTIVGTMVSFRIIGHALGIDGWKIASSLCASYIGGSINYAATAQALGLTSASTLAAGMAADNLAMAAYFAVIMSIPDSAQRLTLDGIEEDVLEKNDMKPTVETISLSLAAAAAACTIGNAVASMLPASFAGCGLAIIALVSSSFSAAAARVQGVSRNSSVHLFAGSETLGASLMLLFFSVVGASAGFQEAFSGGWPLLVFILILLTVHLGVILSLGGWSKIPMSTVLIASNANIGGPATAAAMANCRCWRGLVRPAILVGTLGYTIGTAIGCLVGVRFLQPLT